MNTFANEHLHPEPDGGKRSFFLSSSVRLARQSLNVSPRLKHTSAPSCSQDIIVFDECHFNDYQFCQWYTPTALMKDATLNFSLVQRLHAQYGNAILFH